MTLGQLSLLSSMKKVLLFFIECNTTLFTGMVRQQLDSFDEFIQMSMQELVEDSPPIVLVNQKVAASGDPSKVNNTAFCLIATSCSITFSFFKGSHHH